MPVHSVAFVIPPEIQAGLLTGDLIRYGGVVRNIAGQLVIHLKEVPLTQSGRETARRMSGTVRNPYVLAAAGLGVVVISGIAGLVLRKHRRAQSLVDRYNASFAAYLEAAQGGALEQSSIERLIADLDAVIAAAAGGKVTLGLSTKRSDTLVNLIADYTRQLAVANAVQLPAAIAPRANSVVSLRGYLEMQRQIFRDAA
ncbi:hypothetical protein [Naasia lichenicola]|uniref:Uncharacterized protein n=1 Tax=Naasia lichenicola TaxID=2565933 RepID=A0A4S4FSH9_9MICO|nr:hypothetical protein [Naasia lichenicola]THG33258.1 hypothetical protein E6C64_02590 [Naasia lichenicola]